MPDGSSANCAVASALNSTITRDPRRIESAASSVKCLEPRVLDLQSEFELAEHDLRLLGVVDRVHAAGVRVTPEALDGRARLERAAAGTLEQPVDSGDGR